MVSIDQERDGVFTPSHCLILKPAEIDMDARATKTIRTEQYAPSGSDAFIWFWRLSAFNKRRHRDKFSAVLQSRPVTLGVNPF
jgi:hypothetical protein